MLITIFRVNFQSGFQLEGFRLLSKTEWAELKSAFEHCHYPLRIWFGNRDAVAFDSWENLSHFIDVHELSVEVAVEIERCFGRSFGKFPIPTEEE